MTDNRLPIWTVYAHPLDYPDDYVARLWLNADRTDTMLTAPTLAGLQALLPPGLYRMARQEQDDPVIVEIWM